MTLILKRRPDAAQALRASLRKNEESVTEAIEKNVRKLIIHEAPVEPAYCDKMSKLLDDLAGQVAGTSEQGKAASAW